MVDKRSMQTAPMMSGGESGVQMYSLNQSNAYYGTSSSPGDNTEEVWDTGAFSDKTIRRGFVRKVFFIVMLQLVVTAGITAVFTSVDTVTQWIRGPGYWVYYLSFGVFGVTYFVLMCVPSVRRSYPGNYIALFIFTLAVSYMTGSIASYHKTSSVLMAVGITAAVCLALIIFASQTKIDFTMCSGLLCCLVIVLVIFGLACGITWMISPEVAKIMDIVYASLGALVMSLFLCYDIQMLMGGKTVELSPDEYIFGALQLYLDIVYLFWHILGLVSAGRG